MKLSTRGLKTDEIPLIVEDYRCAAANAKAAAFDDVEIHSANSYLLEQFIRDSTDARRQATAPFPAPAAPTVSRSSRSTPPVVSSFRES
jgi:NADH:flavin oxidoreductase / NADH oxidase family